MVSLYSACQEAPFNLHIGIRRLPFDLKATYLMSNLDLDLSGSNSKCFDSSRSEKNDGVRINALTFFVQKSGIHENYLGTYIST